MKTIKIYARAKINLTLDVLGKREDSYHEVAMIMQTIKLADIIDITLNNSKKITLTTNLTFLPTNNKNIAYKACELFLEEIGIKNQGVHINIFKKIPVSAGLAGGSTNAAAVLIGLNKLLRTKLSMSKLMSMGAKLGADVPFCVHGGTMLATGIGEKLERLRFIPKCKVVLCKPPFSISTASVYKELDSIKIQNRPDTKQALQCIKSSDFYGLTKRMYNVLEDVTAKNHKEINEIKKTLIDFNANGVLMSGSGPTVFGLFDNEKNALNATAFLRKTYKDTHITDVSNYINQI